MAWIKDEKDSQPGFYLTNILFNDGNNLQLGKNDIVIFVGPNNAGKSQTLQDLYNLLDEQSSVVVESIDGAKSQQSYRDLVYKIGSPYNKYNYGVMNTAIAVDQDNIKWNLNPEKAGVGDIRDLFACDLDTSNRLAVSNPVAFIRKTDPWNNPIHYVAFDANVRKKLSRYFFEAFGFHICPDVQYGESIPLFLLKNKIKFQENDFADETERVERYAEELEKNPQVQDQGDGMKSFLGILLYLMLDFYRMYFIDEPESFLHPPQAKVMGRMLGEITEGNKQVFISTHSKDLIQGLLEVAPKRVKLVRITRKENHNHIFVLDNENVRTIWSDPVLKYSNVMDGLFYQYVVLCESDSDCRFYSIIADHMKKYVDMLFTYSGGKQRLKVLISAMKSLGVNTKVIADFDVLNDKNIFWGVCDACGVNWDSIQESYNKLYDDVERKPDLVPMEKERILNQIKQIARENKEAKHFSDNEIAKIKSVLKVESFWHRLKSSGVAGLPKGETTRCFKNIQKVVEESGLFIVPVGELECFVPEVSEHGPKWVNKVLQEYPDLDDPVYDDVKEFIRKLQLI